MRYSSISLAIEVRAPGDATPDLAQVREMTQTLLAERFRLKVSRSNQVMPVYNLIVAPGGPKLKPATFADDAPQTKNEGSTRAHARLRYRNFSMADLVDAVRRQFDRPLLNKTGLTGGFDFTLDYEEQPPPRNASRRGGGDGPAGSRAGDADSSVAPGATRIEGRSGQGAGRDPVSRAR